jgi:hypothetical protein
MTTFIRIGKSLARLILACAFLALPVAASVATANTENGDAGQTLGVSIDPESGRIQGLSVTTLPPGGSIPDFSLNPRMSVHSVSLDDAAAEFTFRDGRLNIVAPPRDDDPAARITITYSGTFPDAVPTPRFGSDNPGFGVEASITPRGVFMQSGSGWHPRPLGLPLAVDLEVDMPRGFLAVTAGRLLGHENRGERTVSRWKTPGGGMPLSAGEYVMERMEYDAAPVMTYFFADNAPLSRTYLEASARHLATYDRLLGPYPFEHFAVVENFFPTGYGMPSYTLLGSTVLRLPFIPETSLRHEVVHCWWGNGVLVDYAMGNWSEGLTTYLADHMAQEEESAEAAREYRLRTLRDYAQLAAGPQDFPLSRFVSRTDPATRAVGYGKAMFLPHMLRQRLGDEKFYAALQDFYRENLFRRASWEDMTHAFVKHGLGSAEAADFLEEWIFRAGAPDLVLTDAATVRTRTGWETRATLAQQGPVYDLRVPVRVETEGGATDMVVRLDGREKGFSLTTPERPLRLVADPDVHVFRLLAPSEIPATINSVKGSEQLTVVVADALRDIPRQTVRAFLGSLNQPGARILTEAEVKAPPRGNLLFFGFPSSPVLKRLIAPPAAYGLLPDGSWFDPDVRPDAAGVDAVFLALPGSGDGREITALFNVRAGLGEDAVVDAARRITHYGKESFLGFERGRNRLRGTWPPLHSPLTVELTP